MRKILIIDDEPEIVNVLSGFLTKMNFEITRASGGEEAIKLLRSGIDIDLIITDMKMPKVTGFDVLTEKANLNILVPVIILTGSIDADKYLKGLGKLGYGPGDIVCKPLDLFELLAIVKKKLSIG